MKTEHKCDAARMLHAAMNDPSASPELTAELQAVYARHFAATAQDATGNEPSDDSGDNSPAPPHP